MGSWALFPALVSSQALWTLLTQMSFPKHFPDSLLITDTEAATAITHILCTVTGYLI